MPRRSDGEPRGDLRWSTFIKNHAKAIVACDFCVGVTVSFRMFYVLVLIEHRTRRLLHVNVTANPTAEWTLNQLRHAIPGDSGYQFLLHDRDAIFSTELDRSIQNLGLRILRTPYRSPQANSICERLIGTLRRECLDWLIPMKEAHLRTISKEWAEHYNRGRPHMSLGPGVPDPPATALVPSNTDCPRAFAAFKVRARSVLGGLHHEYAFVPAVA